MHFETCGMSYIWQGMYVEEITVLLGMNGQNAMSIDSVFTYRAIY